MTHPSCGHLISKKENDWLNSIGLPDDKLHRQVLIKIGKMKFFVDGFDKNLNTIYEFYGDKWHGNPKIYNQEDIDNVMKTSYKEVYAKTLIREELLKKAGYKIITIWESEWRS